MKLIDADALERDGWQMSRTVRVDKDTMEIQTRKPTDFTLLPSAQSEIIHCGDCKYKDDGIDEDGIPFLKCLNGRSYGGTRINDYCSWAEMRQDADSSGNMSGTQKKKLKCTETHGWIPVTEALPRDDEDVIVTCLDDSGDTPYSYTAIVRSLIATDVSIRRNQSDCIFV